MRVAFAVISSLLLLGVSAPAGAIVYGSVDVGGAFGNVGAFIVRSAQTGMIFPICSGTLVAPGAFLTAAHCTVAFEQEMAPLGYAAYVSFDGAIPFGDLTSKQTKLVPVVQVVTNPGYNAGQSDPQDIAVLLLNPKDTKSIAPAALPSAGLLDRLFVRGSLKSATFLAVGYGVQDRTTGGGEPFFQDLNPAPRMYAFSAFNALNPATLRLSQNPALGNGGTCFGDSGGPNFLTVNGVATLVAITMTGDTVCRSTNVTYRTDSPAARQFLTRFVVLP